MIWINEEDHLRIISMEPGSDLSGVFNRLSKAIRILEKSLRFSFSKKHECMPSFYAVFIATKHEFYYYIYIWNDLCLFSEKGVQIQGYIFMIIENPEKSLIGDARATSGFTLTEVVVAGALLAIAVTAIFGAATTAIRTQYTASSIYHATCLARNRIQRGLSLPFNTLPILEDNNQAVDQDGNSNINGPFRRTTVLTDISDNCYKITVTVFYPIGNGKLSNVPVTIESKISRGMHSEEISE